MMGVCESFIVIYGPVWVNNYSPPEHSTKWMGILHSSAAIGNFKLFNLLNNYINRCYDWVSNCWYND